MWDFVLWACALGAPLCDAPPDVGAIQSAYESESSAGSALHDKGLRVIEAACDPPTAEKYLCQVTFLSSDDPNRRLYFDIVAVSRNGRGWNLRSGLCKR